MKVITLFALLGSLNAIQLKSESKEQFPMLIIGMRPGHHHHSLQEFDPLSSMFKHMNEIEHQFENQGKDIKEFTSDQFGTKEVTKQCKDGKCQVKTCNNGDCKTEEVDQKTGKVIDTKSLSKA